MQLAIGDNGRLLWKRLIINRQETLQNVKKLVTDHSYLNHFAEYVSTPTNPLSVAIQNWERHLNEAADQLTKYFSRKTPTDKHNDSRACLNKINEKIKKIAELVVYPATQAK